MESIVFLSSAVHGIEDVEALYQDLMDLIHQLANHGVIHGDFNEFNIMINTDGKPIIIDFPQMISTQHANAEMIFNRDVNCIRDFFKRRFAYESEFYPTFTDISREDCIDIEVKASGVTKQMEKHLLVEMGMIEDGTDDEEESDETKDNDNLESEIEKLRLEVEKVSEEDSTKRLSEIHKSHPSTTETKNHGSQTKHTEVQNTIEQQNDRVESVPEQNNISSSDSNQVGEADTVLDDDSVSDTESVYSRAFSTSQSIRSISTAASIAPEVIKKRIQISLKRRARKAQSKKIIAKGEASATTRARRDNRDAVKEFTGSGIWGCG